MSLAYKLWRIGNTLSKEDIKDIVKIENNLDNGSEINYVNIDFSILDNEVTHYNISDNAIEKSKLFFTKKIGGTSNAYYLYPNIELRLTPKDKLSNKFKILTNTILNIILNFADDNHIALAKEINSFCKKNTNKLLTELDKHKEGVGIYWVWLSINGKTFYECMPEVWDNWYEKPVLRSKNAGKGYDAFTNKEVEIGYKPEIKIFSYDNYHDSLKSRIDVNLPLSLESAKKIKFAWMYVLNNLVFHYKGYDRSLEYIILPNLLTDNDETLKSVIERLRRANKRSGLLVSNLKNFETQENRLIKDLKKIKKGKSLEEQKKLELEITAVKEKIYNIDVGLIQEFNEKINELNELKNSITIDFFFTSIDYKNLAFTLKGTIEDVIPSKLSSVVRKMRKLEISDAVTLKNRQVDKTYLQDFFNREELYFILNKSTKTNSNKILEERLYFAKLLITDEKIKIDNLYTRFEINRELKFIKEKRIKDGIKEWIQYSESFVKKENNIILFLKSLDKLKE